tara:strand:- start:55262 stop:55792 length:531 start_codon:yes stop_codon:yes gene_type:complete
MDIYRKYNWLKSAIKEGSIESYIGDFSFDEVKELRTILFNYGANDFLLEESKRVIDKVNNFDEFKIKEDVSGFIAENTFKIFRDYKFDYEFPDYIQLKKQFKKEYMELLPRMPNEESRENLEEALAKKVLEKTDFMNYSVNLIEKKLESLRYYQIDIYESMDKKGLFNLLFGYGFY